MFCMLLVLPVYFAAQYAVLSACDGDIRSLSLARNDMSCSGHRFHEHISCVCVCPRRHEGVGFSADFVSRRGQPLTSADAPASPLIALQ